MCVYVYAYVFVPRVGGRRKRRYHPGGTTVDRRHGTAERHTSTRSSSVGVRQSVSVFVEKHQILTYLLMMARRRRTCCYYSRLF